jgi:hypothetical protein
MPARCNNGPIIKVAAQTPIMKIDLARAVFQVHGVGERRKAAVRKARRRWLLGTAATLGISALPGAVRYTLAMGQQPAAPGLYRVEGEVRVNGHRAEAGQLVRPQDIIETGPRSEAVFVVGHDAYLLRAGSRLETVGREILIDTLRLVTGKLLSVLGPGARRIETPTATIGIRGTGIYVEAEPERTYICTCYGIADIQANHKPEARETVETKHHDQPRYVYGKSMPSITMIEGAPVVNHTDAELVMLEALVGRRPPFLDSGAPRY